MDTAELESRLAHLLRNWQDDLREILIARHGESNGLKLSGSYARALPAGYIETVSPDIAANDVEQLAALAGPDDLRLSLHLSRRQREGEGRLRRYRLLRQGDSALGCYAREK